MKYIRMILAVAALCLALTAFAQNGYRTLTDIPYVNRDDTSAYRVERCKLDLYVPQHAKGFKTLVWIHGGGLEIGNKEIPDELKASGIAVVAPNYRLAPRAKCPDYIRDVAAAVKWAVDHIAEYGGNPSQVYVAGHSAGGYLTLMLAMDKSYLAEYGIDADSIKGFFPVSGQGATPIAVKKEFHIPASTPTVNQYAPLSHVRKLGTKLVIYTGDRRLEQISRFEENLYLKSALEGIGNATIPLYELNGFNHVSVMSPACRLIKEELNPSPETAVWKR